jgi:hypothetical protein
MHPITSANSSYVDATGSFQPVYRVDEQGEIIETGFSMSIIQESGPVPRRSENCTLAMARAAADRVKRELPGVVVKIISGAAVDEGKYPAIGNAHTNFHILIGGAVAIAPVWILLANSTLRPAAIGQDAKDIEKQVAGIRPGIWGEILDAR